MGQRLAEDGPELLARYTDPAVAVPLALAGIFGLMATAGALALLARRLSRLFYRLAGALGDTPGTLFLGWRRERWYDPIVGPPIKQQLGDTQLHNEVVAPTAGGKTTLMVAIAVQLLRANITALIVETTGDLARRMVPHARALDRPVYAFDPAHLGRPGVFKWNPLGGEAEIAAEKAVTAWLSTSAPSEPYYREIGKAALRRMILAASYYSREVLGGEPTITMLRNLFLSEETRAEVLGLRYGANGSPKVEAPWIDPETRNWFEGVYYQMPPDRRLKDLLGVVNALEGLTARPAVREALEPLPGEPTLEMGRAMDTGGLVIYRADPDVCGEDAYRYLSVWMTGEHRQVAQGRGAQDRLVAAFMDELHNTIGDSDSRAADQFAGFLTRARHYRQILFVGFQSYGLLPPIVRATLAGNAANKFFGGRVGSDDARIIQELAGRTPLRHRRHRHTSEGPLGRSRTTTETAETDRYRYTADQARRVRKRNWLYMGTREGELLEPTVFRLKPAELPNAKRPRPKKKVRA